jgi:hypothetical protein
MASLFLLEWILEISLHSSCLKRVTRGMMAKGSEDVLREFYSMFTTKACTEPAEVTRRNTKVYESLPAFSWRPMKPFGRLVTQRALDWMFQE